MNRTSRLRQHTTERGKISRRRNFEGIDQLDAAAKAGRGVSQAFTADQHGVDERFMVGLQDNGRGIELRTADTDHDSRRGGGLDTVSAVAQQTGANEGA